MFKIFLNLILFKYLLAQQIQIEDHLLKGYDTDNAKITFSSTNAPVSSILSNKSNITYFYIIGNNNFTKTSNFTKNPIYSFDDTKHDFKRKDDASSKISDETLTSRKNTTKSRHSSEESTNYNQKLIENPVKNVFIDFDLIINEFSSFEPKTGFTELDAKIRFKWWDGKSSVSSSSSSSSEIDEDLSSPRNQRLSPFIKFHDDKNVKLTIRNQLYSFNNVETFYERKKETQQTILAKFEKFKTENNKAVAAALLSSNSDVYMSSYKNVSLNKKVLMTKVFRHYSCLEQNITLKFKCKTEYDYEESPSSSPLDTSNFPFDAHACEINFDIIASLSESESNSQQSDTQIPVFSFASLIPEEPNRVEIDNNLFEFFSYNKLVSSPSNYSWISKEWLLKKVTLFYSNLTTASPIRSASYLASSTELKNATVNDQSEKLDHYLMSRINNNVTAQKQQQGVFNYQSFSVLPKIGVKFYIYRRREPQVYIFVLPLVLFTLITFLIFFLPTSNTSEKTLIAFLNFACMLGYNMYLFKLVIYTYDFMRIPLMLQYSNCLMVIQLGVLAYTCLVKSVYHYGFLTFNASSFTNLADEAFKQMFFLNHSEQLVHHEHEQQKNRSNLLALTAAQSNHALDIYSQVDNNLKLNKIISSSNSRSSTGTNNLYNTKFDEKIKEETGMIIYHGNVLLYQ